MKRILVIGDIHGCKKSLDTLLGSLDIDPEEDTLVFLGDYIDRGPDSPGVVDTLIRLKKTIPRLIYLQGNHERLLLNYYIHGRDLDTYLENGGLTTIESYREGQAKSQGHAERGFMLPAGHLDFLQSLLPFYETDNYIFVHAGLRPGVDLYEQDIEDLTWIRYDFIYSPGKFPKTVVFGHTVFAEPLMEQDRIGIDTGAVFGGKLTCLILPDRRIYQVWGNGAPVRIDRPYQL